MFPGRLLAFIFTLSLSLALLHAAALDHFWYWTLRWLDIPMHIAGGLLIACLSVWLILRLRLSIFSESRRLLFVLGAVMLISVLWELFEFSIGFMQEPGYVFDTVHDLVNDLGGGILGYLFALRLLAPRVSLAPATA